MKSTVIAYEAKETQWCGSEMYGWHKSKVKCVFYTPLADYTAYAFSSNGNMERNDFILACMIYVYKRFNVALWLNEYTTGVYKERYCREESNEKYDEDWFDSLYGKYIGNEDGWRGIHDVIRNNKKGLREIDLETNEDVQKYL